ncbi:hypothetical protein ACIG0C_24015 [Kitasatospora aureofaciens]|uniref:DUF680 domain-containing protein n=1 Tax=Kitasatospora aureofaciens TaxID=1894 RepID=A0A8H9HXN8_KITAU|nr:hypothetical protein GCM10010502_57580 [Kitasatospora aureofaciens]
MNIRFTAAVIGTAAVVAALAAPAHAEKPTPLATATAGSTTVTTEAACYNHGDALAGDLPEGAPYGGKPGYPGQ